MNIRTIFIKLTLTSLLYNPLSCSYNSTKTVSWQEQFKNKITSSNTPEWVQKQIDADLCSFSNGITKQMINEAHLYSCHLAHFKIVNGTVYSNAQPKTTVLGAGFSPGGTTPPSLLIERKNTLHQALQDIVSCVPLADTEFLVLLSDGITDTVTCPGPFFTFSKNQHKNKNIILMPDPDVLKNNAHLREQTEAGNKLYPWNSKAKKAFWRGGTNDIYFHSINTFQQSPRFKLVTYAHKNPEVIDALFADIAVSSHDIQLWLNLHNYVGDYLSITDHMRYQYQIQIDGFTAAWARMYWQLFCNSLMLKQDSDNIQWYYHTLKPYTHYIPLSHDVCDIAEKIQWAENHITEVEHIIRNANTFARENLTYADMLYYIHTLLTRYAQLQHFKPTLES